MFVLVTRFFDADVSGEDKVGVAHQRLKSLQSFNPSLNSYLINAFPKSGTHWLWEIITMVVRKQAEVSPMFKEDYFLEMKPFDQLLKTSPYPIVYTTQFPPSQLPKSISNLKRVTILRNPKDVMVSAYHHIISIYDTVDACWNDLFESWMLTARENPTYIAENFWNFTKEVWKKRDEPNVHIVMYENLIRNFHEELWKICKFLGQEIDGGLIDEIYEATEIHSLREKKLASNVHPPEHRIAFSKLYRHGKIGQWKNYFTASQNAEFDRVTRNMLSDCKGLNFIYE